MSDRAEHDQQAYAVHEPVRAPPPPAAAAYATELSQLARIDQGVVTAGEYEATKRLPVI